MVSQSDLPLLVKFFFFLFLFEQSKQPTEMATMENFILRLQNRTYKLQSQSSRLYPLLWVIKLKLFIMCLLLVPFFLDIFNKWSAQYLGLLHVIDHP